MNQTPDDNPAVPVVLVYVRPAESRTPRAAWFGTTDKATAVLAATRQGYTSIDIAERQVELVKAAVREGEIDATTGRLSLAAVKRDVLDRLLANLKGEPVEAPDGSGPLPPNTVPTFVGSSDDVPASKVPVDPLWAALAVNMVVLISEVDPQGISEGWWEAVIVEIHGDVFTLRYRDYPRQPLKHRKREEIAIMYPPPVRV